MKEMLKEIWIRVYEVHIKQGHAADASRRCAHTAVQAFKDALGEDLDKDKE